MDIETLAVEKPEALARIEVDPIAGIDLAKAKRDRGRREVPGRAASTRSPRSS